MNDFVFAQPEWQHALWGVLLLVAFLLWCERRGGAVLDRLLSVAMQRRLVTRPSAGRRYARVVLLGLSAACLVGALMRPQWGLTFESTPRTSAELMICLDVSKSMLAEDARPNRLERAKTEVEDLLAYLEGDHVGLIAFAGKATVLCPLTPDFGFLRLVLRETATNSVTRGGTQLSEPILKALEGFRGAGDASQAILLITDGEDHESYPIDAAKKAAERGVKIFAIGFGDKAGSEVMVTDPRTGARQRLLDTDGTPVITRLGEETLIEMAQVTNGAYIPAGTGMLNLESIYRERLQPLTRGSLDGRGRPMRKEGFQWAVLAALVFLVAAVTVTGGAGATTRATTRAVTRAMSMRARGAGRAAPVAMLLFFWCGAATAQEIAQEPAAEAVSTDTGTDGEATTATTPAAPPAVNVPPPDPRVLYNEALAQFQGARLDDAERAFADARRGAGADGVVRYRATYNLGCVAVERGDGLLAEKPKEALEQYYAAASHFREAVSLRPAEEDARHNLEVVLRRAHELEDTLADKSEKKLEQRLDALIAVARGHCTALRGLADAPEAPAAPAAAGVDTAGADGDGLRAAFRQHGLEQRKTLAEADQIAEIAGHERDAIEAKKEEERTPEEKIRSAQIGALLEYMHRSRERLGQTRQLLRQKRGERASRRAASALQQLKRARDQLRDPVEVLSAIIGDTSELVRYTGALAQAGRDALAAPAPGAPEGSQLAVPAWLTRELVEEGVQDAAERVDELHARLAAGIASIDAKDAETANEDTQAEPGEPSAPVPVHPVDPADEGAASEEAMDPETEKFVALVREALPHLRNGGDALGRSTTALSESKSDDGYKELVTGITELLAAREVFLDLRGLIELVYGNQSQALQLLGGGKSKAEKEKTEEPADDALWEMAPLLAELETKDLKRCERLLELITEAEAALPPEEDAGAGTAAPPAADAEQAGMERERLGRARTLVGQVSAAMDSGRVAFAAAADMTGAEGAARVREGRPHVERSVEMLAELRRLFFTIVEHLKETARRQIEVRDDTAEASALPTAEEQQPRAASLVARERELAGIAGEIGHVLDEQAKKSAEAPAAPAVPGGAPGSGGGEEAAQAAAAAKEMAEKLGQAATLVAGAATDMTGAADGLGAEAPAFEPAGKQMGSAIEKLVQAIALLEPPQPKDDQEQQQQNQEQQQQQAAQAEEKKDKAEEKKDKAEEKKDNADPAQQLQQVRDREAQRRAEKEKRKRAGYDPVGKDW